VIAILGGLGAAVLFATTPLLSARSSRLIGPFSVLSWVMLTGLAITLPLVAIAGVPDRLGAREVGWLVIAGAGNVTGLLLAYAWFRDRRVPDVAALSCPAGPSAVLASAARGEDLGVASGVTLTVIAAGVLLASLGPTSSRERTSNDTARAVLLSTVGATAFGISLYAFGKAGSTLPIAWALLPARLIGSVAVALPLAARSRLLLTRPALPLVVGGGACEVVGLASFAVGARHGIAVSAVLASQFGAIAAIAAFVLFRERLTRLQLVGIAAIATGVAVLSALQA
jgi:uncharacterized membrane protein